MQGVIALLLGSAGGLLVWAVLAQQKVSKLRSKYAPITNAEEEAERIRKRSSVLQEQSKKTADSIVAKGQAKLRKLWATRPGNAACTPICSKWTFLLQIEEELA